MSRSCVPLRAAETTHDEFTPPTPLQLRSGSDEQLIDWVRAAQVAGHALPREQALEQPIGGYADAVLNWNLKVPDELKEDLARDLSPRQPEVVQPPT